MICKSCAWAADHPAAAREFPEQGHAACPGGTWCFCQHRQPAPHDDADRAADDAR